MTTDNLPRKKGWFDFPKFPLLIPAAGLLMYFLTMSLQAGYRVGWTDNEKQAMTKAKAGNKLVLLDFTGSDWCIWCQKLDKEVFSTPEFKTYAARNLELVTVDFPQETYINPQTKKQNVELQKQYEVEVFPTIIVLNAAGKQVGHLNYMEGGPKPFIAALEKMPKS